MGVAIPVVDKTTDDADSGTEADGICGLSTGVAVWTTKPIDPGAAPASAALAKGTAAVEPFTAAAVVVGSFGLAFFFEPDAAPENAPPDGRITCPSGPSFVWEGFGGSSWSNTGAAPLALALARRRS